MPVLTTSSGKTITVAADLAPRVAGLDADGNVVIPFPGLAGKFVPLTWCCHASGKGSSNSPTGVCCRGCYRPVDVYFGGLADVVDSVTEGRF